MAALPVPCPVRLGIVKNGGLPAQLHRYTMENNLHKMEKLLKKVAVKTGAPSSTLPFSPVTPGLLDAGEDLRLHDHKGRSPRDWAEAGAQEHSARPVSDPPAKGAAPDPLLHPVALPRTLLELLMSGGSDLHLNRKMTKSLTQFNILASERNIPLSIDKPGHALGLLASQPVIRESELGQVDNKPLSFTCGSFITMTKKDHWNHLMVVGISSDLLRVCLLFERIHMSSLHNLLHQRRAEFPVVRAETMLLVVLQVCEALLYLHGRALVPESALLIQRPPHTPRQGQTLRPRLHGAKL
ncbi:unnamed protein product [Coregonus sp. 'balchen']|nr:unnamed protein product [Coregonus sp. 'balchen']